MGRRSAIGLFGLLLSIQPASSQEITTHPLTVIIHETVRPSIVAECRQLFGNDIEECISKILKDASDVLQQRSDALPDGCKVGFSLKGPVGTFTSGSGDITDDSTLEEVHQVPADVKVVRSITHCIGENNEMGILGCSWRPGRRQKTVIVTPPLWTGHDGVLWAHEYGHTTGLLHRFEQSNENLMTPCSLRTFNKDVNESECRKFVAGPVRDPPQGSGDECK